MTARVVCGDCLEVMRGMEADSMDTVITDPPYELGFMGKSWDSAGVSFRPETWAEVLRVAKPGATLLAFGGSRTFHRIACAIEDAGWVLFDTVMYLYGSGFPKSHNYGCRCHEKTTESSTKRVVRCMPEANLSQAVNASEECGEVLFSGMSEQGASQHGTEGAEPQTAGASKSGMEGGRHLLSEARELQTDQIRPLSNGVLADGAQGRVCDGTSVGDGSTPGSKPIARRGGASSKPRPTGQPHRKPATVSKQLGAQAGGGVCEKCGGLIDFRGWGTALKPAFETIICARKPNDGTNAQNALKHGVAGLWIEGGRIAGKRSGPINVYNGRGPFGDSMAGKSYDSTSAPSGRFPANVILDEEAGRLLDEQSGTLKSGVAAKGGHRRKESLDYTSAINYADRSETAGSLYGDSGGASRFFYCAKASRKERNAGLENVPAKQRDPSRRADQKAMNSGDGNPYNRGCKPLFNNHPTVKPLALMRYLARLTKTPTGGTVLDPFCGSGTTGMACVLEGREFIGIEQDERYAEIARKRIEGATQDTPLLPAS